MSGLLRGDLPFVDSFVQITLNMALFVPGFTSSRKFLSCSALVIHRHHSQNNGEMLS